MKKVVVGFLAGLALSLAGGIAFAGIPDSGGTIHTCYDSAGKLWRPIDTARESCKPGEVSLSFNQKGPKGDLGPQGPKGDTGLQGPAASSTLSYHWAPTPVVVGANSNQAQQVDCPAGKKPISGGFKIEAGEDGVEVRRSEAKTTGWYVLVANYTNMPVMLYVQVVCI